MKTTKVRKQHQPLSKHAKFVLRIIAGVGVFVIVLGIILASLSYFKYI